MEIENTINGAGERPRPSAGEAKAASDDYGAAQAMQNALDLQLWDVRLAAILNTMEISRAHGEHRDWTAGDAERIRAMLDIVNRTVVRDGDAVVPDGFGALIRSPIATALIKAQQEKAARPYIPEGRARFGRPPEGNAPADMSTI